jgi:hypothetical protein
MMHRCEPHRTANDTSVAHVLSSGLHAAPGGTSEGRRGLLEDGTVVDQ